MARFIFVALAALAAHASAYSAVAPRSALSRSRVASPAPRAPESACTVLMATKAGVKAFVVGVAADSGCGKSTFMRRLTNIFGGKTQLLDIGRETNTLVSDKTTVICLDDYHLYDRKGRSANKITALNKDCQKWDLMAEHVRAGAGGASAAPTASPGSQQRAREGRAAHAGGGPARSTRGRQGTGAPGGPALAAPARRPAHSSPSSPRPPPPLQVAAIKAGNSVSKPIYNHITGELDADEQITPTDIVIFEGLHPMLDDKVKRSGPPSPLPTRLPSPSPSPAALVTTFPSPSHSPPPPSASASLCAAGAQVRAMLDLSIYLDISDEVKFAWKIQRDMQERGASLEEVKASIKGRKPDFDAYVAPQRALADIVIEVLPTQLVQDEEGKFLRVRFIQKAGLDLVKAPFLFDEGSTIEWTPCGKKLTCAYPGIKFRYGPEMYMGSEVSRQPEPLPLVRAPAPLPHTPPARSSCSLFPRR